MAHPLGVPVADAEETRFTREAHVARILVVDDDPAIREFVRDVLELEDYEVQVAEDGPSALQALADDRPDCMILDVMMPGLSGHDVLARVRQNDGGPGLPVIMLTAKADETEGWQAFDGGADYFLAKPFDSEELLRFLNYLFADSSP
jgi:DNA-binding response OmpR family regulator